MKWCIITTIGRNPGDEFIREGIINLINEVDNSPEYILVDKETKDIFQEHSFDKCVLAGMPLFWSFHGNNFWNIEWWNPIINNFAKDKNKFMIAGAGSFQNWKDIHLGVSSNEYTIKTKEIINRAWKIYLRDNVPNILSNEKMDVFPCPAIFSTIKYEKIAPLKLCNMMPSGGHYEHFDVFESREWKQKARSITDILSKSDFRFISHHERETKFAIEMGWEQNKIIQYDGKPSSLLKYYKNCVKFFGNRVHGAIVSQGVGADVLSCGFDSRQEAVRLTGAKVILPSKLELDDLRKWIGQENTFDLFKMDIEYNKQKKIFYEFANI